jgi:hypothetical protein
LIVFPGIDDHFSFTPHSFAGPFGGVNIAGSAIELF